MFFFGCWLLYQKVYIHFCVYIDEINVSTSKIYLYTYICICMTQFEKAIFQMSGSTWLNQHLLGPFFGLFRGWIDHSKPRIGQGIPTSLVEKLWFHIPYTPVI